MAFPFVYVSIFIYLCIDSTGAERIPPYAAKKRYMKKLWKLANLAIARSSVSHPPLGGLSKVNSATFNIGGTLAAGACQYRLPRLIVFGEISVYKISTVIAAVIGRAAAHVSRAAVLLLRLCACRLIYFL